MRLLTFEMIWLGINNIWLHKLRSFLTALGIIFGVAAVICMLSVSEGVTADELRMIELLGTQNIIVNSVKPQQNNQASQGNTTLLEYGIRYADLALIETSVPHVATLVPLKTVAYSVRRHDRKMEADVVGTTAEYFDVVNTDVSAGRLLTPLDSAQTSNVCVIGANVRRQLFTYEDPIGQHIFVVRQEGTEAYKVVGLLETILTAGAPQRGVQERNINAEIYIPYGTAVKQYGDNQRRQTSGSREFFRLELSGMYVNVDALDNVMAVSRMVRRIFEHNHDQADYEIRVPLQSLQLAERKKRNSQLLLGFIAGISLLVGGIGIMNIMLATVTERTREIGIRRALGARQHHITMQFLVETAVLSTAGGIVGVLLGYVGSMVLSRLADWGDSIVRPWAVLISFGLSVMVGIIFGLWPAMKAARLDPIEALRYQ